MLNKAGWIGTSVRHVAPPVDCLGRHDRTRELTLAACASSVAARFFPFLAGATSGRDVAHRTQPVVGAALEVFRVDALSMAALRPRRARVMAPTAMVIVEPVFGADAIAARCADRQAPLTACAAVVRVTG